MCPFCLDIILFHSQGFLDWGRLEVGITWIRFSCHLLFVGGSCGFLSWRGVGFCRNSDEREVTTLGAFIAQNAVSREGKLAFGRGIPSSFPKSTDLLAIPLTTGLEKGA